MTRPRLPSYLKGVSDTRRSLGDGTLEGRVRSATPYQLRSLKGVGRSVPAATVGSQTLHHWIALSAQEPREVPLDGLLVPWTEEHWRHGFASPALGQPDVELSLTGNHTVFFSFEWQEQPETAGGGPVHLGGGLVEVLLDGTVITPNFDDPDWDSVYGDAFSGAIPFRGRRGQIVQVRVRPHADAAQWMRLAALEIRSDGTGDSVLAPVSDASIEFLAVEEAGEVTMATGTSVTVDRPPEVSAGDFMVAFITHRWGGTITPPTGWDQVAHASDGSGGQWQTVYTKVAGSSEPTSYTWSGGSDVRRHGAIIGLGGAPNYAIDDIQHTAGDSHGQTNHDPPPVTSSGVAKRHLLIVRHCIWSCNTCDWTVGGHDANLWAHGFEPRVRGVRLEVTESGTVGDAITMSHATASISHQWGGHAVLVQGAG